MSDEEADTMDSPPPLESTSPPPVSAASTAASSSHYDAHFKVSMSATSPSHIRSITSIAAAAADNNATHTPCTSSSSTAYEAAANRPKADEDDDSCPGSESKRQKSEESTTTSATSHPQQQQSQQQTVNPNANNEQNEDDEDDEDDTNNDRDVDLSGVRLHAQFVSSSNNNNNDDNNNSDNNNNTSSASAAENTSATNKRKRGEGATSDEADSSSAAAAPAATATAPTTSQTLTDTHDPNYWLNVERSAAVRNNSLSFVDIMAREFGYSGRVGGSSSLFRPATPPPLPSSSSGSAAAMRLIYDERRHAKAPRRRSMQTSQAFVNKAMSSLALVRKMKLSHTLDYHEGCVNALNFNRIGTLLASASDDYQVCLWDWARSSLVLAFESGHKSNVFQAKFVPFTGDSQIVTCARDGQVRLSLISSSGAHIGAKRLAKHSDSCHKVRRFDDFQPYMARSHNKGAQKTLF